MKYTVILCFNLLFVTAVFAQELPSKWSANLNIGQYTASLATVNFSPLHLGVQGGVTYQWNKNQQHQIIQSANLAYFYHKDLQHGIQLYSAIGYEWKSKFGLNIMPLSVGGGYVLSILDMDSFEWDAAAQQYVERGLTPRNNWIISFGSKIGYASNLKLLNQPTTFYLSYQIQIQGIFMDENIPIIPYTSLMIGMSIPF